MATEHASLSDPQIHEPKGVVTAAARQVYTADGAASGSWAAQSSDLATNGSAYLSGFVTATVISVVNTPVVVNAGTSWVPHKQNLFTVTTGGRLTFDGAYAQEFLVLATLRGTGASGTQDYSAYIAKNGTVEVPSRAVNSFVSTTDGVLTVMSLVTLSPTDYVELWIENNTNIVDFTVKDANIVIGRA